MPEDKVQMPSLRKDGTPDQTENYEIVGDKEGTTAALAARNAQRLISEADQKRAAEQASAGAEGESLSPEEQALKDEYDALAEQGKADAEAEVEARWVNPASRQSEPEETTTRRRRRSAEA